MNHTVSVIIPVLNAESSLREVLEALEQQTYPQDLIEVIVVDNGSSDDSREVAASYGAITLSETEKRSPYAARNRGFEEAGGSIIALTDANKIPDIHWIMEGVRTMEEKNADLVGGCILFDLEDQPTNAELVDAITYNDNHTFVTEQQSSAAGNLFFKRDLLKELGQFPDQYRSGMDIWWTQYAVQQGFRLLYSEKAVVYCKPRKLKSLLKKSFRVGVLHPATFRQKGHSISYILSQTFRTFAPPRITRLRQKLKGIGKKGLKPGLWITAWFCRIMMGLGRVRGLAHLSVENRTRSKSYSGSPQ